MRALVIDEKAKESISQLIEIAKENKYDLYRLKKVIERVEEPVGDQYAISLQEGYKVVYSIEEQPLRNQEGTQWTHHISVSVSNDNGIWPSQESVAMIMKEFGMPPMEECAIYLENENDNTMPSAVNVIGEYEGEM